ncbi:MAG: FKBP-type peptidyl-prolyl cis-trans isomerase [Bacteroidota bacterium]
MSRVMKVMVLFITTLLVVGGCREQARESTSERSQPSQTPQSMEQVNRVLAEKDQETIKNFLQRRDWSMERTPTGLWYRVLEHRSDARKVTSEKRVTYTYHTRLLDGTLCYSSDESGPRQVELGTAQLVPGMKEALLLLHEGDSAQFIVPPHLAYGLVGDQKRIPARAILFYAIRVQQVAP